MVCTADAVNVNRHSNANIRTRPKISDAANSSAPSTVQGNCPEPDGFFADSQQCDKYYVCKDDVVVAERLCPDGMVFNDFSPAHEKCDLPFNIDCSHRAKLRKSNYGIIFSSNRDGYPPAQASP